MHTVGLVGCGGISGCHATPKTPAGEAYGHLFGIHGNPRVKLVAVADPSPGARQRFLANWGEAFPDVTCYDSAAAMFRNVRPDIVDVCVPGPAHFRVMTEVIAAGPRIVLLEKAPTCSLEEMDLIVAAAGATKIPITVSYSRHWSPTLLRLEHLVREGLIGEVRTVVGYCPGWLFSMCSHQTDMICQFAGYDPVAVTARGSVRADPWLAWHRIDNLPPGYGPEPHADVLAIEYASGAMGLQVGAFGEHGWLYCDVFGSEGYVKAAFDMDTPAANRMPVARNSKGEVIDLASRGMPDSGNLFRLCYDQIADYLDGGPLPCCTNEDWMAVHEIGFAGVEGGLSGQRIELPCRHRTRKLFLL